MDFNHRNRLLDKYWNAKSTVEEEQFLKNDLVAGLDEDEDVINYFESLHHFSQIKLDDAFDERLLKRIERSHLKNKIVVRKFWPMAAAILIIVGIGIGVYINFNNTTDQIIAAEHDPEKAFELTKQALLLVSGELNRGASYTLSLEQFDKTVEKIKTTNK